MDNLYNESINEFINWKTGQNTFTGDDTTGGLKVSGKSIRELLQDRLQHPFVMKEDVANNKYRMFSSETAYQLWLENPSDNASLELFNFVRPSDYKLTFTGLNNANRYIRYGDNESLDARIQYSWSISNDEGLSSESLQVTYTITNESSGKINTFTRWYNAGENIDFSIYSYLQPGRNSIVISGIGVENGARNSSNFNIVVLELTVESTFQFYKKYTNGTQVRIPCTFKRNDDSGTARIHYVIDAGSNQQSWTTDVLAGSGVVTNAEKQIILDLPSGQHTLQIWAECSYNEGSVTINTNLLYFTFVVATSDISTQKYICIGTDFSTGIFPIENLTLFSTQYLQSSLQWGYYTEALSTDSKITVVWKLYENEEDESPITLSTITANTQTQSSDLQFIPTVYSEYDSNSRPTTFLSAQYNNTELLRIPIQITRNGDFNVYEVAPYALKMSAYGKTNDSSDKDTWSYDNINTTFTNIQWNQNSGWYNNSFRVSNQNEYATIDFQPFADFDINESGKTIEIEFETEKVNSDNDVLVCFGTPDRGRIEITPTRASLYANNDKEIVHTNYKSNERLKLAFIINDVPQNSSSRTASSGLVYIVNNGILERAADATEGQYNNAGTIKIGGTNSGIRIYSIRIYNYALTYTQAYNNFLYDSDKKAELYEKNNIIGIGDLINYDLCKNKIDTILISGDLSAILNKDAKKDDSVSNVTIQRTCPTDSSKNFKIVNAKIRKHGQSTLNYPVSSMKVWFNKSTSDEVTPTFEISPQEPLSLGKNRYRMKNNSIPSNKFVLQANYADSSGVHNGGLQRLIQDSWYNAVIDGKYLLRTEPQLFTSIDTDHKSDYGMDKVWQDSVPNNSFPYQLRISPDSFPCVVFYQNTGDSTQTFLGQYVFMDDKKSDFLYGERSIYKVPADPFCLTTTHAKDDTKQNKIWDNNKVLRIEVIESNNVYSSYMTADGFDQIENITDDQQNVIGRRYKWEGAYEMIYPDPDDIEGDAQNGTDKFGTNSLFADKAKPFVNWYKWVVSTRNNQQKFQQEAAGHLDLYKMAAYYIFALRFGLVDSLERNAQIKTYDGVHFHYEPWDMDIALGNKNDGGIAYEPPIDRNTLLPNSISTYAFSGRSGDSDTGNIVTTNWLWDALEAWPEWMNVIVPDVAGALYKAGLNYDNICKMFDDNYANVWNETIYNKSGDFKYVQSREGDNQWLSWLQGARLTHRHWWLSTSMDYYDAKWFCGEYKEHSIYITANVSIGSQFAEEGEEGISGNASSDKQITITPNKSTYMVIQKDNKTIPNGTREVTPTNPLVLTMPVMNTKNPFHVYGANYMETIDLSQIATGLDAIDCSGVYSSVLGSPLKTIIIGCTATEDGNDYLMTLAALGGAIRGGKDAFENLQNLNIRGQRNFTSLRNFVYDNNITSLQNVYAMGSGLTNFYSSEQGNTFNEIELPSTISMFQANDSTWNTLTFWDTNVISGNSARLTQRLDIPYTIESVILNGTSCQNFNSISFVKGWLASIAANGADLSNYTFKADKINWNIQTVGGNANLLTYDELAMLAQMGTVDMKGYILLKNENDQELTTQQLTQIKTWFGDSVFDRNSSGLVVDHQKEYIQINVGGDVTVDNGEIYIREGSRASLNATRFLLSEEPEENYAWGVEAVAAGTAHRCNIIPSTDTVDHVTYLQTQESQIGGNYDIRVSVSVAGDTYSTIIHVIGVTYPTDMKLAYDNKTLTVPRETPLYIAFHQQGMAIDAYANSAQNYTATIRDIRYIITDGSTNTTEYNTKTGVITDTWNDSRFFITKGQKGVNLSWPYSVPDDDEIISYNIKAIVTFVSGKQITVEKDLIVLQDSAVIINSLKTVMYNAIKSCWEEQFGETFGITNIYRTHLLSLHGELEFVESNGNTLDNLVTQQNTTLLKYIPNVTSLIFDGCTNLTFSNPNITENSGAQFIFTNMPHLQTLSIQNCTSLTGTIDLSGCPITTVNAAGTTVNVTLPTGTTITSLALGAPTSVVIDSPTVLEYDDISVTDPSNITNVELTDVNSTTLQGFKMFGQIMGIS